MSNQIVFSGLKVLLTDGAARQALTILHGLKEIGCQVTVLCSTKLDVCYASKLPDRRILDKDTEGVEEGYIPFLLDLLKREHFDIIVPVSEMTTNKITQFENEIKKYTRIAGPTREAYIQAFNKQRTFEAALDNGVPCPNTRRLNQTVEEFLKTAIFPLIIKPRNGVGSIGFHKFEKAEDFWPFIQSKNINLDDYVLQEFVPFKKRPDAYILMDSDGEVKMSLAQEVVRWYPLDAGSATMTRSIDCPEVIEYASKLLKAMKYQGFANVCFMIDERNGSIKLLEINGRIPAGIKMSWFCGFNVAKQLIELAYDEPVTSYPGNTKFGLMARHSQADFLWFLHSPERFKTEPSWFSRKNTCDLVYWKGDPKPVFAYTMQQMKKFKKNMKLREH